MERDGGERMHQSYNDAMDGPGDTQPDSQMYKEWTSGVFGSASHHHPAPIFLFDPTEQDDADPPTEGVEGAESSQEQQQQQSPAVTSPTVIMDDYLEMQQQADALTSPLKFETPAMAGRKRDSQGQVLSSAFQIMTTPRTALSASAFFGASVGNGGIGHAMSLTQAFNATQAGTSPAIGGPSDDPVFQRPSPNFTNARNSSPILVMSSPIKAARSDLQPRSSSEPRAEYVTMKQSQELRQRQRDLQRQDTTESAEQDSWNAPTEAEKRMNLRRQREQFEKEAGQSLARVSAPPLSSPRSAKKRGLLSMNLKFHTPAVRRRSARVTYDGSNESDDDAGSTNGNGHDLTDGHLSDDSPDELSQDIPSITRPSRTAASAVKDRSTAHKVQVPNTSSHPRRTFSGRSAPNSSPLASPSLQLQREPHSRAPVSQTRALSLLKSSKESVTIMDSQPEPPSSVRRPNPLLLSSPGTNQYSINQTVVARNTGLSSQVVSSSMPPLPPKYTSSRVRDEEEERVPSSPPVITHDNVDTGADDSENDADYDDVMYDEHAYDDHSGGEDEEQIELQHCSDTDMDMNAESDVPEPERELNKEYELESKHDDSPEIEPQDNSPESPHDEVPETEEQQHLSEFRTEDDVLVQSSHSENNQASSVPHITETLRLQRQSTVPESDFLEDNQPIVFAQTDTPGGDDSHEAASAAATSVPLNQTNSTEPFDTAQEYQTGSHPNESSNDAKGSMNTELAPQFLSLNDIANQPGTQNSVELGDIEIPQLSFNNDMNGDFDTALSGSSPLRPAVKKRKIMYSARRKAFGSPVKDFGPLSDQVASSPLKQVQRTREGTSPSASVKERELRGAHTAENIRVETILAKPATLKSAMSRNPTKPHSQRKGALKPVNKSLFVRGPSKSPHKTISSIASKSSKSFVPTSNRATAQQVGSEMPNRDVEVDDVDELAGPTPQLLENSTAIDSYPNRGEAPTGPPILPNRLFANWPGQGFYTATCIGREDARHVKIRYDDGNMHSLEIIHVRALDLRIGDQVKVNEPGKKKHVYVVVGFKDKIDGNEGYEYPQTDCRGYATVVLEQKQKDNVLKSEIELPKQVVSAPVGTLYMTGQMWSKFHDRIFSFTPHGSPSAPPSRVATPTDAANNLATPSLSRRGTAGPSFLKESINRAASVASSTRGTSTVFSKMVFAITLTQDSADRDAIAKAITSNGGHILEDGFQALFDDFDLEGQTTAKGKEVTTTSPLGTDELVLKEEYKDLRFAALISDSHSRRTKYVQALALNLPCLHFRWIQDSVSLSRPLAFSKYLLPAGISTFLDPTGIVRSRTLELYDPGSENLKLENVVRTRDFLLSGQKLLLVTNKSKKEIEKKKPYFFLMRILGPEAMGRCKDLETAKSMIKNEAWDWAYVDGGPSGVVNAAAVLFGKAKPFPLKSSAKSSTRSKNRKRKREESEEPEAKSMVIAGSVSGKKIHVACDEFVIQSLILGALVDE
ncbi:hypothetical protein K505DRAFT_310736 [Melanomma pulvis-pyrius CBS 109.77]|uniref:BRCT domain-containing protein n=1 Tax=Melanomma pulvis-pyrius CBS 109.77 TaxID=1314802 RepID=A0A6A6X384_9PLEO|nr:hypothetical protein K505DRAFT_310736 [Melanomma pulvis-pyrius CBS 109.77]